MFHRLLIFIAMNFAFGTVLGQDDNIYDFQYTVDTYHTELSKSDHLIMFYTPWCGHSQRLLPTWRQLATERNAIEESQVRIARVDCVAERAICSENNIFGVPTVRYFKVGNSVGVDYTGDRSLESLNNFIDSQSQSQQNVAVDIHIPELRSKYWHKCLLE